MSGGRLSGGIGALVVDLCRRVGILETRPETALDAVMTALGREAEARTKGDADQAARIVHLTGTLVLPAGAAIVVGRMPKVVAVSGLKKSDRLSVTLGAPLPTGMSMVEAICAKDGELTIGLLAQILVAASATETRVAVAVTVFR